MHRACVLHADGLLRGSAQRPIASLDPAQCTASRSKDDGPMSDDPTAFSAKT